MGKNDSSFLQDLGLQASGGFLNSIGSYLGMKAAGQQQKELLDYQMNRYYSPQAQVNNLAAAGINPAVAFGNQSPVFSSGGSMPSVSPPQFGIGTTSLTDLGNYIKAVSDVKKNSADTDKVLAETDAIKFQNDLQKEFGFEKWTYDLGLAYENVLLAQKTNDIKEQEKAINEFKKASESALATANEYQRDILKKRLDNTDTELRLANKLQEEKVKTEKSAQSANYASARYSSALADTEDGLRELKKASQTILNGIEAVKFEEDSKTLQSKIDKLASEVGIAKWTAILQEVEARDKNAYHAIQRLIMGKSVKGDASTIIQALSDYEKFTFKH